MGGRSGRMAVRGREEWLWAGRGWGSFLYDRHMGAGCIDGVWDVSTCTWEADGISGTWD